MGIEAREPTTATGRVTVAERYRTHPGRDPRTLSPAPNPVRRARHAGAEGRMRGRMWHCIGVRLCALECTGCPCRLPMDVYLARLSGRRLQALASIFTTAPSRPRNRYCLAASCCLRITIDPLRLSRTMYRARIKIGWSPLISPSLPYVRPPIPGRSDCPVTPHLRRPRPEPHGPPSAAAG